MVQRRSCALTARPKAVQEAIDDPDVAFSATHGVTLKQAATRYGLKAKDMAAWVKRTVDGALSVAGLKRALNAEHREEKRTVPESIFRSGETDKTAGVFRLQPVKVVVAELNDEDKAALREELEELLKALG